VEGMESLLSSLESRVDMVLFRSGRATSVAMARHRVHHRHVRRLTAGGERDGVLTSPGVVLKPMDVLEGVGGWPRPVFFPPATWGPSRIPGSP